MTTAPAAVRSQPGMLLPSKKSRPTPRSNGRSDRPKVLRPKKPQKPELTVTWLVSR